MKKKLGIFTHHYRSRFEPIGRIIFFLTFIFFYAGIVGSNELVLPGSDIPLINSATILKSGEFHGSGRFELEVDIPPAETVKFYHQVMQERGWPEGRVMSTGNKCVLVMMKQGETFTVKAEKNNSTTRVIIAIIKKSSAEAALKAQTAMSSDKTVVPASGKTDPVLPRHEGVTIEGSPYQKGDFIKRIPKMVDEGASPFQKKDDGNLPDDPSPEPDKPEPEEPSDEDSSDDDTSGESTGDGQGSQGGIPDILPVAVNITARWEVVTPGHHKYEGIITMQVNGNMKKDESGSPSVYKGLRSFQPSITYRPEGMAMTYTYNEQLTSLKKIPEGQCQDPLIEEFHGGGVAAVSENSVLRIHRFASMAAPYLQNLSSDKQQFLASIKGSMTIPDYYEISLGGPASAKRVQGKRKNSTKKECTYIDIDKSLRGCQVGVQMELPESGDMSGNRTWSADDQGLCPPAMGVFISDIATILKGEPLKPPEGGNRNVTYVVGWRIGQAVSGGPGSPEIDPEENTSKPCKPIENRLRNAERIRALYLSDRLRQYVKDNYGQSNWDAYQQTVENVFELINDDSSLRTMDGEGIESWLDGLGDQQMQNICMSHEYYSEQDGSGLVFGDSNEFSCSIDQDNQGTRSSTRMECNPRGHSIDAMLDGKSVPIIKYDRVWGHPAPTEHYATVCSNYIKKYGEDAGMALFQASLNHEMTHADQFKADDKTPFDINKGSLWEQDAYKVEIDTLKKFLEKFGC